MESALLLTDSTMPVSFCKAGIGCAKAMAKHLGSSVHMVDEVHLELERKAEEIAALKSFLEEWPPNPVRQLDVELKAQVAQVLKARQVPGQHPDEDRGEVATVFYANERREEGELFDVVTDDGFGKQLARDRGLEVVTTASITIDLVRAEVLSLKDGKRVWQECTSRAQWARFEEAVGIPSQQT
jgi:hypothetical protein